MSYSLYDSPLYHGNELLMRNDEKEGRLLARFLAEAIKSEIKTGADSEWKELSKQAVLSLSAFGKTRRHSSEKTACIIQKTIINYKKNFGFAHFDEGRAILLIHSMLVEAINHPDVRIEWRGDHKETRFKYAHRFLLGRITGLQSECFFDAEAGKILKLLRDDFQHLKNVVSQFCPASETLDHYDIASEKMETAIEKTRLIASMIIDKKSAKSISDELISLIESFDPYLSKVQSAILEYRIQTSCAGGFCNFFTIEDSKDKAMIRDLKKTMESSADEAVVRNAVKKIISEFPKKCSGSKTRLLSIFSSEGLVEAGGLRVQPHRFPLSSLEVSLREDDEMSLHSHLLTPTSQL